jgi:tetratricopeptide (TPR) repeat protein
MLNLSEACIYGGSFEKALKLLKVAEERDRGNGDIYYLYGELNLETGNIRYSIDYYEKAITLRDDPDYYYRLADVYVKLRRYEAALETLEKVKVKDVKFLLIQAELYVSSGNVPAAIKCMERALLTERENVELWTRLAEYHRLDYDLNRAFYAVSKALNIDAENDRARLESARIKKALGKTKEYQASLHDILKGFKRKYREIFSAE